MKKFIPTLLLAIILLFTFEGKAQNKLSNTYDDFYKHIGNKIKYPEKAILNDLQGKSLVLFTIANGRLEEIKIDAELGSGCDAEVVNGVLAYPNFKSMKDGKYALNANFRLKGAASSQRNENEKAPEGYTELNLTIMAFASTKNAANVHIVGYGIRQTDTAHMSKIMFSGKNKIGSDPKIIIDGVETPYADVRSISPTTIQSISIYKGADAITGYGPGAVNGVIVITTKKDDLKLIPKKDTEPILKKN